MCDRCEELEEEIWQLKRLLAGGASLEEVPQHGLTPHQWVVYKAIANANGRVVSAEKLLAAARRVSIYGIGDPKNHICVVVCNIRKKLAAAGLPTVRTLRGHGYYLETAGADTTEVMGNAGSRH